MKASSRRLETETFG